MRIGDKVTIIPGVTLKEIGLEKLVGQEGIVLEIKKHGCWIELCDGAYSEEREWFIPESSLN